MKKRIISAAIMIAIILPLVIIGKIPFAIFVGLVSVMAFKEMSDLYVAGIDGIDIGASQTSKETKDPSDFCIVIKKRIFGMNEP